jgi:Flp pilus assembly protein TadG
MRTDACPALRGKPLNHKGGAGVFARESAISGFLPQAVGERGLSRRRGSGLIEGALCFSAFLFLVFGVIEFAMAIYAYNFCSYAAQDAARWASTRGANYPTPVSAGDVQSHVANQAVGLANIVNVTTTWSPDNKPGGIVQVTVQYSIVPLTGVALHSNLQVGSTAQMVVSN